MKLYIRQKIFAWDDVFDVRNEKGNKVYKCTGEDVLGRRKFTINEGKSEAAVFREKIISLRPKYAVETGGEEFEVIKKIIGIRDAFKVKGLDWDVQGDFIDHEYRITEGKKKVAVISKKLFSAVKSYELDVADKGDAVKVLAVAIAIDAILASEEENKEKKKK